MLWKIPTTTIFWVPVPHNPEIRISQLPGQNFELTNKVTEKPETFLILDVLGAYPIHLLPAFLARDCTGKPQMNGETLAYFLKKKVPEFKNAQTVLFYQLTKSHDEN